MVQATKKLPVGDGLKDGTFIGPIQNPMQFERVKGFIKELEAPAFKIATGRDSLQLPSAAGDGYFLNPVIVDNPPDDSRIVVEEPFGE